MHACACVCTYLCGCHNHQIFKLVSSVCKALRWFALNRFGNWLPAWYLAEGWKELLVERLSNLQRSTSLTRKFLKLGLAEGFLRLLVKVWFREKMSWRKLLALGRLAGMTVYFFWNYPVWACKVGLIKASHKMYTIRGLKGYLVSVACQMILDTVLLVQNYQLAGRLAQYEREMQLASSPGGVIQERLGVLAGKRHKHWINLFKNICDCLGAVNGVWRIGLNDLHVGVLGMISSGIGCALLYSRLLHEKELERQLVRKNETSKQTWAAAASGAVYRPPGSPANAAATSPASAVAPTPSNAVFSRLSGQRTAAGSRSQPGARPPVSPPRL